MYIRCISLAISYYQAERSYSMAPILIELENLCETTLYSPSCLHTLSFRKAVIRFASTKFNKFTKFSQKIKV